MDCTAKGRLRYSSKENEEMSKERQEKEKTEKLSRNIGRQRQETKGRTRGDDWSGLQGKGETIILQRRKEKRKRDR